MARSRKAKPKSTQRKGKKTEPRNLRGEILGVVLAVVSVFLFLSLLSSATGMVGEEVKRIMQGLFGIFSYVVPLLTVTLAVVMIMGAEEKISWGSVAVYGAGLASLACLIQMFYLSRMDDAAFLDFTSSGYDIGVKGPAGCGFVTAALLFPALKYLGTWGSGLLFSAVIIIIVVVKLGLSLRKTGEDIAYAGGRVVEGIRNQRKAAEERRESLYIENMEADEPAEEPEVRPLNNTTFADSDEGKPLFARQEKPLFIQQSTPFFEDIRGEMDGKPKESAGGLSLFSDGEAFLHTMEEPQPKPQESKEPSEVKNTKPKAVKEEAVKPVVEAEPEHTGVYRLPPIDLLSNSRQNKRLGPEAYMQDARKLEDTLMSFGVKCTVVNVSTGPAITRYELQPAPGVKISRVVNLSNDIALSMAASGVRMEAPIPGKAAIGVEIPNANISMVSLRDVLEEDVFQKAKSPLTFCLGKDIAGKSVAADLARMPHMLIAGATGSGKSVCINSLIISLLYHATPDQVRMIMIDPKVVELGVYNGIPHLLIPVVTDPKKAAGALNWAVQEMVRRYELFARTGARDLTRYRELTEKNEEMEKLPQIVIVIDELADLMMVAPNDVEDSICRIAQMARAAGMHLVIATQRPSVDVITGIIKANIPSRIAFAVSSQVDSRTILDMAGAEKLLGRGDMLFSPSDAPKPIRIQGAYVSDAEVERVTDFIKAQMQETEYDHGILDNVESYEVTTGKGRNKDGEDESDEPAARLDPLLSDAIDVICDTGQASISMLQRRLRLGYARAARMIDELEQLGIVSASSGSKPRDIIMGRHEAKSLVGGNNDDDKEF